MIARLIFAAAMLFAGLAAAQEVGQMRLIDDLDRPGDGYCIDILGAGSAVRTDLPLIAHNCLPETPTPDRAVTLRSDGTLYFPTYGACVTAFGVNTAPLPGAPLVLAACGARQPFLEAQRFQRFDARADGRLALQGSDLCLTVGPDAAPTYSASHRWRVLTVERCALAPIERAAWAVASP